MFNFFKSQQNNALDIKAWSKMLEGLMPITQSIEPQGFLEGQDIEKSIKSTSEAFEGDLKRVQSHLAENDLFEASGDNTREVIEYLRQWHVTGEIPSLAALAATACEKFGVKRPDYSQMVLTAAILGEIEHDLPYHNNLHFKKVLVQVIRLIAVHNDIYKGTAKALSEENIACLLAAACIHDLGHDGLGNTVKGAFYSGRLERLSIEYASPYLEKAGAEKHMLETIKVMLLITDVSPLGDVTNPMHQMKAAYRFHFMGEKERLETLNLCDELEELEKDSQLAMMACLLQEADIATSAGLDYTVTQFETCQYRAEIGCEDARPIHILDFLDKVCQRTFLSDAGQKLFGANIARIYTLAQEAENAGNEAFPKTQHTDFILGKSVYNETSKTLN